MSKFITSIPVHVAELIGRLPKGSSINGVTLRKDNAAVDVEWEHDDFQTPYTFAVECPDVENPPVIKRQCKAPATSVGALPPGARVIPCPPPEPAAPETPVSGQAPDSPSQETAPAAEAPRVKKKQRS